MLFIHLYYFAIDTCFMKAIERQPDLSELLSVLTSVICSPYVTRVICQIYNITLLSSR